MKHISPELFIKMSEMALKARDNAYATYSNHPVGAAILSESGKIYSGANCEIAHYKGVCAEASAISAMITAGERVIRGVVVAGPGEKNLATPCGDCRQRIREFASGNILICSLWKNGKLGRISTLNEILPFSFGPENMGEVGQGPKKKTKNNNKKKKTKNAKKRRKT